MNIISVVTQKGGVAKTTSVINIAASLARRGKKTLVIDMDPQCNCTLGLGAEFEIIDVSGIDPKDIATWNFNEIEKDPFDIEGFMFNEEIPKECVHNISSNLDLIKSNPNLGLTANAKVNSREHISPYTILKNKLKKVGPYDFVLIDCPPSLDVLTINAVVAATHILIPVSLDSFSLMGLGETLSTIRTIQQELNPKVELLGIFATKVRDNLKVTKQFRDYYKKVFKSGFFKSYTRENTEVVKSTMEREPVYNFNKNANGAKDYEDITKEILRRIK